MFCNLCYQHTCQNSISTTTIWQWDLIVWVKVFVYMENELVEFEAANTRLLQVFWGAPRQFLLGTISLAIGNLTNLKQVQKVVQLFNGGFGISFKAADFMSSSEYPENWEKDDIIILMLILC